MSSEDKDKLSSVCDQVSSWTAQSSFKDEKETTVSSKPVHVPIGSRVIGPQMKPVSYISDS